MIGAVRTKPAKIWHRACTRRRHFVCFLPREPGRQGWDWPRPRANQLVSRREVEQPEGVNALTAPDQALFNKIKQLPPQRMAEVEDFVDFLHAREDEQRLTRAAAKASVASFAHAWDNDEDAAYDRM